jgi:FkbM family methyltransferase
MTPLQRLARRLGYDLAPRRKARSPGAQLAAVLERFSVTCVLDVGANVGQYARRLRAFGYAGRIVSFEPLPEAHTELVRRAAPDPVWQVAPRMAIGEREGEVEIELSAESDMSSILPQSALLRRISPSSAVIRRERVPIARLDRIAAAYLGPDDETFLKIDVQGYEHQVIEGARDLLRTVRGIQLEMSLVPCYEGERGFRETIDHLEAAGFELYLLLPGYFERKLARQLQVDGVFIREQADPSDLAPYAAATPDQARPDVGTAEQSNVEIARDVGNHDLAGQAFGCEIEPRRPVQLVADATLDQREAEAVLRRRRGARPPCLAPDEP